MMPSRIRSWIRRSSSSGLCSASRLPPVVATGCGVSRRGAAPCLATVPPCDDESEDDVETAEATGEDHVGPGGWGEESDRAEAHEAESHEGDDADRERAS